MIFSSFFLLLPPAPGFLTVLARFCKYFNEHKINWVSWLFRLYLPSTKVLKKQKRQTIVTPCLFHFQNHACFFFFTTTLTSTKPFPFYPTRSLFTKMALLVMSTVLLLSGFTSCQVVLLYILSHWSCLTVRVAWFPKIVHQTSTCNVDIARFLEQGGQEIWKL